MNANELRRAFLEFFEQRGHTVVPSAGLIPHHPTAPLFTNAGMNQFVPYFLDEEPAPYPRATSVQKCVRLSGKHNDISELGKTRRHLTFFEMLGNWSFGDYFKEEAIRWAWELTTEVVGFDGDRIWITVHETDDEAEAIWHEIVGLPMERIQRLGKENFWEMGTTGPCGPCSELHYDSGPEWGDEGGPKFGGGDRYIEFWNLVFMAQLRAEDGSLSDLPKRNIDTGAGLERCLMLLEGVPTVFETDALRPYIAEAERLTGTKYGDDAKADWYLRIIGDHARTMTFLVNDGVAPSNEARGYILRSVIRRAVRRVYQLGVERPVLGKLVESVVAGMGEAYPELVRNKDGIVELVSREEARFRQTLRTGSNLLDEQLESGRISGEVAFRLHDTYGFPVELTEEIAEERDVPVDREGFETLMQEQRRRAKEAAKAGGPTTEADVERYREILDRAGPTEFTGREEYETKAQVLAVLPGDDGSVEVFLDKTPFYAEAGGQVGDTGTITTDTGTVAVDGTTYAIAGLHRHTGRIVDGEISPGQEAVAGIDAERRDAIRRNHTGTHILHWALREVLGPHVKQQGSLVDPEYLRFDFNHFEPVTPEQLAQIEDLANREVLSNDPVRHYETTREHAEELGAIAFFGEKYGDVVRVLEAGPHSTELCGGTHVRALGDIGPVKVTKEESIGANMRRIFATTGTGTLRILRHDEELLDRARELLRVDSTDAVVEGIERRLARIKELENELKAARREAAGSRGGELAGSAVDGVVVARVDGGSRDDLRDLAVSLRDRPDVRAVVLAGEPEGGGVALVAAVTPGGDLSAPDLIAEAASTVGGGGGKKGDVVVAGGRDPSRIDEALDVARAAAGIA
jgi:alanyl-tRNA synthetase